MQEALEVMLSAINAGDWKVDGACDPHATIIRLTNRLAQPERVHAIDISQERVDETAKREHEPYGYLWFTHQMERRFTHYRPKEEQRIGEVTPLYTAPPKREWVGLTEDDVHDAFNYVEMVKLLDFDRDRPDWCEAFASACEATLRHKNGGNK